MKRNFWKGILIALCAAAFCAALAACGGGEKPYAHLVTFNYNYPFEGDYEKEQYIGVTEEYPYAVAPSAAGDFKLAEFDTTYELEGWYLPKLDEAGEPVVTENRIPWGRAKEYTEEEKAQGYKVQKYVDLGEKWDFSDPVTEDITLYAKYVSRPALVVLEEEGGRELSRRTVTEGARISRPSAALSPKKDGYTFVDYYADGAFTTPFAWDGTYAAGDTVVYARFIAGTWDIVTTAELFSRALSAGANIFIPETVAEIDFTGEKFTPCESYNGHINGNGCLVKGISVTATAIAAEENLSLFGDLGGETVIENISISAEISYTIPRNGRFTVSMLANSAAAGATLKNVTVSGAVKWNVLEGNTSQVTGYKFIRENHATVTDCNFEDVTVDEAE